MRRVHNASTRYLYPSILVRGKFALVTRLARMVVAGLPHHERKPVTSMIGNSQGETEIPLDLAEGVLPTGKEFD